MKRSPGSTFSRIFVRNKLGHSNFWNIWLALMRSHFVAKVAADEEGKL